MLDSTLFTWEHTTAAYSHRPEIVTHCLCADAYKYYDETVAYLGIQLHDQKKNAYICII